MFKLTSYNTPSQRRNDLVDFYNMVDDFFTSSPFKSLRNESFRLDVETNDDGYLVHADLPGVDKKEIKINYQDQVLTIEVERDTEKETDNKAFIHRERQFCSMKRALHLPDVDAIKIKAKLDQGVLTVHAAKQEVIDNSKMIEVE